MLLKRFRKRCHLTQQQLATAIGVHRTTIGRWEEGSVLPESKAVVLELARHLRLDDQEARSLLEASLTALTPHWSVPLPRNPFFTGREEILEALHAQLSGSQVTALTQSSALHGLGGVGKTQVALEYAYRHALEYSAIFWIGAETDEQIVASLLHMAETLQLPEREDKDQQRLVTAVQRWLTTHNQWLLIWDNVEDLDLLQRFLPATRSGAMLITTRRQTLGTLARGLDLAPMKQEEGILFLLRRAKVLNAEATSEQVRQLATRVPVQYTAAAELVAVLGGLPLALDQAGAYLEETRCGLPAYLELFRARRATLLQQRGEGSRDHPASVSTTFTLAITAITQHHPAVRDLLQVCTMLQPDVIPEELFRQGGEHLGAALETVCGDALEWDRVVGVACSYSLLSRQPEDQTLSMHRLVQAVFMDAMTETERELWSKRVIGALDAVFPEIRPATEYTTWKRGERLLPHALLCLHRVGAKEESLPFASLAYKAAQYLRERSRYAEAETLYQHALHIREQVLGPEHPEVATLLNYLAAIFYEQSKYAEVERLLQRVLRIREQALGTEHPDVARALNNLGELYRMQSKYAEAERLLQRAWHILEQALGPDHLSVANTLNTLGIIYAIQARYGEAERLLQRGLRIRERTQGPDHPQTATALDNLAELFRDQGKYTEAEPLYRRALHIWEQAQGSEHPDVALGLNDLAELFRDQGKYTEAEPLYRRALHIWKQSLGPDHPMIARALTGLANLSRDQGQDEEAEVFYHRALAIREQHLDAYHPETAETLHGLALLRKTQGKLSEALSLAERALSIRSQQALGDAHPKTIATQALYTQLLQEQADEQNKAPFDQSAQEVSHALSDGRRGGRISPALQDHSISHDDPFQKFLDACCELHPRAWCRSADLWEAYERWSREHQEQYPLSRAAFTQQVKAAGCRADRTNSARIWRGVALRKREIVTKSDGE
jgi:tetratricopeptide (TPR) repeat protein/DNA-binding XRE family transcriptional regulator